MRDLAPASIAFNTPTTIRLHDSARIQLLLSPTKSVRELQGKITAIGAKEGARIRVSREVEARLTGFHFNVEALSPERQPVSNDAPTEWNWAVEPTQTGTQNLHLTLTAFLDVQSKEVPRTIRVFDRKLQINVTWYDRLSGFVSDNWKWLWTTILVPAGLWLGRRLQKRQPPVG